MVERMDQVKDRPQCRILPWCRKPAIGHLTTGTSVCREHLASDAVIWADVMQPRVSDELPRCAGQQCPLYSAASRAAHCKATARGTEAEALCVPALLEIKEAAIKLRSEDVVKTAAMEAWVNSRRESFISWDTATDRWAHHAVKLFQHQEMMLKTTIEGELERFEKWWAAWIK